MKKIIKLLALTLLLLIITAILFFFWAKSTTISSNEYNKELKYPVAASTNDSILTVMSYNIGYLSGMTNNTAVRPTREFYKNNEEQILKKLSETHPDLVGFQEIDYGSKRSYKVNQHNLIAKKLYPHTVQAINWDKKYVPFPYFPPSVHFGKVLSGQSIMSKFPLASSERIVLEEVASQPFYYKALYLHRILQVTTVKHPLGDITFMNVHAEAFDQETRQKHIDFVYHKFWEAATKGPVILVGDFNSDTSYKNSAIKKFLDDTKIGTTEIDKKSYPTHQPNERLDYIFFTKKDFDLINGKIISSYGAISDHLPCVATLKFKK